MFLMDKMQCKGSLRNGGGGLGGGLAGLAGLMSEITG